MSTFEQFLSKARSAALRGEDAWAVQSTGERVAVALALNRADWLADMDYTIADAIDRAGGEWVALIPRVVRELKREGLNVRGQAAQDR